MRGGARPCAGRPRVEAENKRVRVVLYFTPRIAAMVEDISVRRMARELEPIIENIHERLSDEKK